MTTLTPMTAYRTVTATHVMQPPVEAKPGCRAASVQFLMKHGVTPERAMAMIEHKDKYRRALPLSANPTSGRASLTAARIAEVETAVLAAMTRDWRRIDPDLCRIANLAHDTIRRSLASLTKRGQLECRRGHGNRLQWRLPE